MRGDWGEVHAVCDISHCIDGWHRRPAKTHPPSLRPTSHPVPLQPAAGILHEFHCIADHSCSVQSKLAQGADLGHRHCILMI